MRRPGCLHPFRADGRLQEHHPDNPQVIVCRNHAVEHADDDQPGHQGFAGVHGGGKDVDFADEDPRRRHANQCHQRQCQGNGEERAAAKHSGVVGDFIAVDAVADADDGEKGGQVGRRVRCQIEQDAAGAEGFGGAGGGDGGHAHQDIAGVGHGAVSEQALDVALGNCHQVADGH